MPVGGGKTTDPQKKRSKKKQKSKSKPRTIDKVVSKNPIKQNDLNKLTAENISSLRWDQKLTDPILENNRIEQYKELRRQRYMNAQQQVIDKLVENMKITVSNQ